MKKVIGIALVCLAASVHAQADRWESFMVTDKFFMLLDKRSVKHASNKVTAWFMLDYREKQTVDGFPSKEYWSSMWRVSVNCKDETMLTLHSTQYASLGMQGDQVSKFSNQDKPEWYEPIIPESVGEGIHERLCKRTSGK